MKIMLKLIYGVMLVALTLPTLAQSFGIKGGLNLANMIVKDDDGTMSDDFKMNPGYLVGLTAEIPVAETASFETGLFLSTKGFKMNEEETFNGSTYTFKSKANLLYLDIPLLAKAYFDAGPSKIYGAFGPYLGYGLSGKIKSEVTGGGETETDEEDVDWGSGEDNELKRLDYGLMAGVGIEVSSLQIGLNYSLGLANIASTTENGSKANNRVLSITVAYKLNSK